VKTYTILYAEDVPHYATVEIQDQTYVFCAPGAPFVGDRLSGAGSCAEVVGSVGLICVAPPQYRTLTAKLTSAVSGRLLERKTAVRQLSRTHEPGNRCQAGARSLLSFV
jgi:hypothetical protein